MKSFYPESWRQFGLEEKGANNVIGGADHALGTAILWRCVGTGKAKGDAMGREMCA